MEWDAAFSSVCPRTASERRGNNFKRFQAFWPESGLDCLMCAMFARQRPPTRLPCAPTYRPAVRPVLGEFVWSGTLQSPESAPETPDPSSVELRVHPYNINPRAFSSVRTRPPLSIKWRVA